MSTMEKKKPATRKKATLKPSLSQRIVDARSLIKKSPLKKGGYNSFSHYDYFTPEQINQLVSEACETTGLVTFFNLNRTEFGLEAKLTVEELDGDNGRDFTMAMEIPSIKATNVAQQLGGAMTYAKRYLEMTAFDIVENSLDFDTTDNTKRQVAAQKAPAKDANSKSIRQAPKAATAGQKPPKSNKKIMNEPTAKYFEQKIGDIPMDKIEKALDAYDLNTGWGKVIKGAVELQKGLTKKDKK